MKAVLLEEVENQSGCKEMKFINVLLMKSRNQLTLASLTQCFYCGELPGVLTVSRDRGLCADRDREKGDKLS